MTGQRPRASHSIKITAGALIVALLCALLLAGPPAAAQSVAIVDPFPACMDETGDGKACLERQGGWYDWAASEAACQFVGDKVDAIIAAGGDAKWADLFRNERCARLGLPHGPVAAAAGVRFDPDHPYRRCLVLLTDNDCFEILGRHSFMPYTENSRLENRIAEDYRAGEWPDEPKDSFKNERRWRIGFPHFEPD